MSHLRIGIWFDERHMAYGGPTAVLLGTLLGFYQDAETRGEEVRILLNEPGDLNWDMGPSKDLSHASAVSPNFVVGPFCFQHRDGELDADQRQAHATWVAQPPVIFPSEWFRDWITSALPFQNSFVWGAGVDTDFFTPADTIEKTQDFFIYFKSQRYEDLVNLSAFLFNEYFGIKGTVLTYYYYDREMLRQAARTSRFCIMLDKTETQGLAALEIMACDCPLFVLDTTVYEGVEKSGAATSVTCWDTCCGMKSSLSKLREDFPVFLTQFIAGAYSPRAFVMRQYSYSAAAHRLRTILSHAGTT